jgi:hypothetical protein
MIEQFIIGIAIAFVTGIGSSIITVNILKSKINDITKLIDKLPCLIPRCPK